MDLETARKLIVEHVREQLGKVVELRGLVVARQPGGRAWIGDLVRVSRYGEVRVGTVGVTEDGRVTGFGADQLEDALARTAPLQSLARLDSSHSGSANHQILDLAQLLDDEGDSPVPACKNQGADQHGLPRSGLDRQGVDGFRAGAESTCSDGQSLSSRADEVEAFFEGLDTPRLRRRISNLLFSGRRRDLLEARELLPLLLSEPESRAAVLRRMAELELWLGDVDICLGYLEAAARELADRADVEGLEQVAQRCRQVLGEQRYRRHSIAELLAQTLARLRPIAWLDEVPVFRGLRGEAAARVAALACEETLPGGTALIREEDRPVHAFVVKDGRLSVWVEGPAGSPRFVRCCFPGEFVGESSVLGAADATCTASVRAEGQATVWRFDGLALKSLADELPELRRRVESTALRHRLDSFFTLSDGSEALDTRLRDRLLACFSGIREVSPGDVLLIERSIPETVYLLSGGAAEIKGPSGRRRPVGPSRFIGLRDAIHELPHEGRCVAVEPCRLVCFDPLKLRALVTEAPPEVLAALDALE